MRAFVASDDFRRKFDAAFSRPALRSAHGRDLWLGLTLLSDTLAGPMWNVLNRGHHDYVYRDQENRFPGVKDSASFRSWALTVANEYSSAVTRFQPKNEAERCDKDTLSRMAEAMIALVELSAAEISADRDIE